MSKLKPLIGVINLSTKISNSDVKLMTMAAQIQIKEHLATAYERDYWYIMFYEDATKISPRAYPIIIVDHDKTPNALGFHAIMNNKPYGRVMADPVLNNGGVALYDSNNPQNTTISSVFSHEVCELFVDPFANLWADNYNTGDVWAVEACDPVQSNSYTIMTGKQVVSMSNFILPAFFDAQNNTNPVDHLGILTHPFTIANGGYAIVRKNDMGKETEVFGNTRPAQWIMDMKKLSNHSRTLHRISQLPAKKKWWKYFL